MPELLESVAVGLGECKTSNDPNHILVAFGLGSCIGVGVYDPISGVAGLLHAVLPQRLNGALPTCPKYVDSGFHGLLEEMKQAGAERRRLVLRIAGGANVLVTTSLKNALNIGERNIAATHTALAEHNLRAKSLEVGGSVGRTMRVYVADGRMTLRLMGSTEREF